MATSLSPLALKVRKAVVVALTPLMAQDAIADITPAFVGFQRLDPPSRQWLERRICRLVDGKIKPQLAMDDVSAGLRALLEALGGGGPTEGQDAPLETQQGGAPTSMRSQDIPTDNVEGAGLPENATPGAAAGGGYTADAPPPDDGGGAPPPDAGGGPPPDGAQEPGGEQGGGPIEKVRSFLQLVLQPEQMQHLELLISEIDKGSGGEPAPVAMQPGGSEPGGQPPKPPAAGGGVPPPPKAPPAPAAAAPKAPPAGGSPFPPKKQAGDAGGPPPFKGMPQVGGKGSNMAQAGDEAPVSRRDLQAALAANDQRHRVLSETREFIRRYVGDVNTMAQDSAEGIVKVALQMKGFPEAQLRQITELPALKAMLELQSKATATRSAAPREQAMALDAKDPLSIESMFPTLNLGRIKVASGSSIR